MPPPLLYKPMYHKVSSTLVCTSPFRWTINSQLNNKPTYPISWNEAKTRRNDDSNSCSSRFAHSFVTEFKNFYKTFKQGRLEAIFFSRLNFSNMDDKIPISSVTSTNDKPVETTKIQPQTFYITIETPTHISSNGIVLQSLYRSTFRNLYASQNPEFQILSLRHSPPMSFALTVKLAPIATRVVSVERGAGYRCTVVGVCVRV